MNMTDHEPFPQTEPIKPKRKAKRRAAPPRVEKQAKPDELAGITATDCCEGCRPDRCVITGLNVCGHPYKSAHPTLGPEVQAKILAAKKRLRHQKVEARDY